ncbi:Sphingolipid Transporter [Paratrimastix pyriformis]|uniref:Sphingolipid Transporter n=1 Tax=Paratrimastix pyriformis TaxID=342808 RepID=A0ABQ8ULR2_9EUKA|nr:Sphingolipid Transporter [Paratrimastix pyriformis]
MNPSHDRSAESTDDILPTPPPTPVSAEELRIPSTISRRFLVFLYILLLSIWVVIYVDRGAMSGCVPSFEEDFNITHTMSGMVGSSFMFGYMVACPLFGFLSTKISVPWIILSGLACWLISAVGSGIAPNFILLLIVRCAAGIGETGLIVVAPTFIDDTASPKSRAKWLATLFIGGPLGQALGTGLSGPVTQYSDWRYIFYGESALMVLLILLVFLYRSSLRTPRSESARKQPLHLKDVAIAFGLNPVWILATIGQGALYFFLGNVTYWGPTFCQTELGLDPTLGNYVIGGGIVISCIIGTAAGASIHDRMCRRKPGDPDTAVQSALLLSWTTALGGLAAAGCGFWIENLYVFFALIFIGIMLFSVSYSLLQAPTVYGALRDWLGDQRLCWVLIALFCLPMPICWFFAWLGRRCRLTCMRLRTELGGASAIATEEEVDSLLRPTSPATFSHAPPPLALQQQPIFPPLVLPPPSPHDPLEARSVVASPFLSKRPHTPSVSM